jgi:hypothetical protein
MMKIWYYKRRTRKLRKKAGLPELYDKDDLPDPVFDPNHVRVLTDKQQYQLHHRESLMHDNAALLIFFLNSQSKRSS